MVTGAARGICDAIAGALAAEGANVAVCDLDLAAATSTSGRSAADSRCVDVGPDVKTLT
jgi:2-hydroxycyclohexanecarboxyl-CoA dehydrogenase